MNLQIKKFNPKKIDANRTCVFVGKRGTGKSTLVTDILYHHRKIPMGVVMSATEESNEHYKTMVPDLFIYSDFNADVITNLIAQQKAKLKKGNKEPVFILLDDCMYDKKHMKHLNIRSIFMNGRHWNIFFMLTMQYCMDITPDLRANIDYVFILRENIRQNRDKLYKHFFGIFPDFNTFSEVMDQCTENYECLVLDNTSKSCKIEDCVFWYKARPDRKFKIGSKSLWRHHKANYNPKHDDIEPSITTNLKKNKTGLIVRKEGKKKKKNKKN